MNKTYLVGYYGMQNSGDDALLTATVWGAQKYMSLKQFVVNTPADLKVPGYGHVSSILVNRQSIPAHNRMLQYRAAVESDRVIFGGGSVLQNARDIDLKRDLLTLAGGRGHLALGVGIGPFENWKAERSCKKLLERCEYVGVRDSISLDIAKAIAPRANVELTFDLAPLLLLRNDFTLTNIDRSGIAVCLCPKERLYGNAVAEQKRYKQIAKALEDAYFATGETIVFLDFNGHPELGDGMVHREVANLMDVKVKKQFVTYDPNPLRVLQRVASFKVIVSMRLHGSIFGFMANTPVLSINYHQKCEGWCDVIGMPESMRFSADEIAAGSMSGQLIMGLEQGFAKNNMCTEDATYAAVKNWRNNYVEIKHNDIYCNTAV